MNMQLFFFNFFSPRSTKKFFILNMVSIIASLPLVAHEPVEYDQIEYDQIEYDQVEYDENPSSIDSFPIADYPLIDLEESSQEFVLETKRIEFPGFKGAFNPTLIRYQDQLLMAFRVRDSITRSTNAIGIVALDENFNPLQAPQIIHIPRCSLHSPSRLQQDPRLVSANNKLFLVYSDMTYGRLVNEMRRVFMTELQLIKGEWVADRPDAILHFEGAKDFRSEKNWVPFEYDNQLLLGYSLTPHRILNPLIGSGTCETVSTTLGNIQWDWGVLRGGTPALLQGNQYLAFFHSSKKMATVHSQGRILQHYFVGAYTFAAHPPFEITGISPEPIIGKNFYHGLKYKTWKPLHVVFPCGYVADDQFIWLVYGRQDHEIWVAKLDKQRILNSLIPVKTLK